MVNHSLNFVDPVHTQNVEIYLEPCYDKVQANEGGSRRHAHILHGRVHVAGEARDECIHGLGDSVARHQPLLTAVRCFWSSPPPLSIPLFSPQPDFLKSTSRSTTKAWFTIMTLARRSFMTCCVVRCGVPSLHTLSSVHAPIQNMDT